MTQVFGYERYLVQGGDWGGYIASRLGHVIGLHSNSFMFMVRHDGAALGCGQIGDDDASEEERAFTQGETQGFMLEGGYSFMQGT